MSARDFVVLSQSEVKVVAFSGCGFVLRSGLLVFNSDRPAKGKRDRIHSNPLQERSLPQDLSPATLFRGNAKNLGGKKILPDKEFQEYFNHSEIEEILIDEIRFDGAWKTLSIKALLLGLKNGDDNALALGILNHFSGEKRLINTLTPLRTAVDLRSLRLALLRLTSSFEDEKL